MREVAHFAATLIIAAILLAGVYSQACAGSGSGMTFSDLASSLGYSTTQPQGNSWSGQTPAQSLGARDNSNSLNVNSADNLNAQPSGIGGLSGLAYSANGTGTISLSANSSLLSNTFSKSDFDRFSASSAQVGSLLNPSANFNVQFNSAANHLSITNSDGSPFLSGMTINLGTPGLYTSYGFTSDNHIARVDFTSPANNQVNIQGVWVSQQAVDPVNLRACLNANTLYEDNNGAQVVLFSRVTGSNEHGNATDGLSYVSWHEGMAVLVDGDKMVAGAASQLAAQSAGSAITRQLARAGQQTVCYLNGDLYGNQGEPFGVTITGGQDGQVVCAFDINGGQAGVVEVQVEQDAQQATQDQAARQLPQVAQQAQPQAIPAEQVAQPAAQAQQTEQQAIQTQQAAQVTAQTQQIAVQAKESSQTLAEFMRSSALAQGGIAYGNFQSADQAILSGSIIAAEESIGANGGWDYKVHYAGNYQGDYVQLGFQYADGSKHLMYIQRSDLEQQQGILGMELTIVGLARNQYIGADGSTVSDPIDLSRVKSMEVSIGGTGGFERVGAVDLKRYDHQDLGVLPYARPAGSEALTRSEIAALANGNAQDAGIRYSGAVQSPSGTTVHGQVVTYQEYLDSINIIPGSMTPEGSWFDANALAWWQEAWKHEPQ